MKNKFIKKLSPLVILVVVVVVAISVISRLVHRGVVTTGSTHAGYGYRYLPRQPKITPKKLPEPMPARIKGKNLPY